MKIIFTDTAKKQLKSIYKYYKKEAGIKIANSIKNGILDDIEKLKKHPHIGSQELYLNRLKKIIKSWLLEITRLFIELLKQQLLLIHCSIQDKSLKNF